MFLIQSKLTSLIKEAYKNNLEIGNLFNGLVLKGGHWVIWMDEKHVSKKTKAIIMELMGFIPGADELFCISKQQKQPQVMIEKESLMKIIEAGDVATQKLNITPLSYNPFNVILLQHAETKSIMGIRGKFLEIICKDLVDLEIEGEPTGPAMSDENDCIYWYNDICMVAFFPTLLEYKEPFKTLETLDFGGEEVE